MRNCALSSTKFSNGSIQPVNTSETFSESVLSHVSVLQYNEVRNRLLPMPSNMGIGTAYSLAHFLSLFAQKKILTEETLEKVRSSSVRLELYGMHVMKGCALSESLTVFSQMAEPILTDHLDHVNGYEESKGFGFQYTKNPFVSDPIPFQYSNPRLSGRMGLRPLWTRGPECQN